MMSLRWFGQDARNKVDHRRDINTIEAAPVFGAFFLVSTAELQICWYGSLLNWLFQNINGAICYG